ncbi:MAG: hypothetical protein AB8H79_01035 [Myxococcota bacterium]
MGHRFLLATSLVFGLFACAPKAAPQTAAAESAGLEGTWWLLLDATGPPVGELRAKGPVVTTVDVRGKTVDWSFSAEGSGWELRGPSGRVLQAQPLSPNDLFVFDARGNASQAVREVVVPSSLVGRWILRDPNAAKGMRLDVRAPVADSAATITVDGETSALSCVRSFGRLGWVLAPTAGLGPPHLAFLHPQQNGSWLVSGEDPGRVSVLYRESARPSWVPAEP